MPESIKTLPSWLLPKPTSNPFSFEKMVPSIGTIPKTAYQKNAEIRQQKATELLKKAEIAPETLTKEEAHIYNNFVDFSNKKYEETLAGLSTKDDLRPTLLSSLQVEFDGIKPDRDRIATSPFFLKNVSMEGMPKYDPITKTSSVIYPDLFSIFNAAKQDKQKNISEALGKVNNFVKNKDYEALYNLWESLQDAGGDAVDKLNLPAPKTAAKIKALADAVYTKKKIEETHLNEISSQEILSDPKTYLRDLGVGIRGRQFGDKLYSSDNQLRASQLDPVNKKAQEDYDKLNADSELAGIRAYTDYLTLENTQKQAEYARVALYNLKNKDKVDASKLEQDAQVAGKNLEIAQNFNSEKYLEKNYKSFYQEIQQHKFEQGLWNIASATSDFFDTFNYTNLGLATINARRTLSNTNQDLAAGAESLFSNDWDTNTNYFTRGLYKYDNIGYTIGTDEKGNPVKSSQFYWKDKQGNRHINGLATVEAGIPIAYQMVQTIALGELGGVALGALAKVLKPILQGAAEEFSIGMPNSWVNAVKGVSKGTQESIAPQMKEISPRLQTFASVYTTTYPTFLAEELNNFKDSREAKNIASLRAIVEALTESIVPNTPELLSKGTGRLFGTLEGSFARTSAAALEGKIVGMFPGISNRATKYLTRVVDSPEFRRLSGMTRDILQEGVVEEELSLVGNYFVDQLAKTKNPEYVTQNDLTWDNILSTAIESTAGMLITAPMMGGETKRADRESIYAARWEVANNPEQHKSYLSKQLDLGKITQEDYIQKVAQIDTYATQLKTLPSKIESIRDLNNLLEDKDAQYHFFSAVLEKENLLNYVPKPEEKEQYEKELEALDRTIYKTKELADKYEGLSREDKKKIIFDNYKHRTKSMLEHEDFSPAHLLTIINRAKKDLVENPNLYNQELQGHIADLENSWNKVKGKFTNFLSQNNDNLTFEQLDYKLNYLLPANKEHYSEKTYDRIKNILSSKMAEKAQPFFEIENEDEFIDALAKNYITAKDKQVPLTTNGKPLLTQVFEGYVNNALFSRFTEGLEEEYKTRKEAELKEKFWQKVVDLKKNLTQEQTFPEVPVSQEEAIVVPETSETLEVSEVETSNKIPVVSEKYQGLLNSFLRAKANKNAELQMEAQGNAIDTFVENMTPQNIFDDLTYLKEFFPDSLVIDKIIKDLPEGNTKSLEDFLRSFRVPAKKIEFFINQSFPKTPEIVSEVVEEVKPSQYSENDFKVGDIVTFTYTPTRSNQPEVYNNVTVTKVGTDRIYGNKETGDARQFRFDKIENLEAGTPKVLEVTTTTQGEENFQERSATNIPQEGPKYDENDFIWTGAQDTTADNKAIDDPNKIHIRKVLDRIGESPNHKNIRALGYYLKFDNKESILQWVLGFKPEWKEDYEEFKAQFKVGHTYILDEGDMKFYHKDSSRKFSDYNASLLVDEYQNPLLFNQNGVRSQQGTPFITNVGKKGGSNQLIKEQGRIVAPVSHYSPGAEVVEKASTLPGDVKELALKLHLQSGASAPVTLPNGNTFMYYAGNLYIENFSNGYPRIAVSFQNTENYAKQIYTLIEQYGEYRKGNNPDLDPFFREMEPAAFMLYLNNYAHINFDNSKADWQLVSTKKEGRVYLAEKGTDGKFKPLSKEASIAKIATTFPGIPKQYFEGTNQFRPFRISNGKVLVGPVTNYKEWVIKQRKFVHYVNPNIAVNKSDLSSTIDHSTPVSPAELPITIEEFIPQETPTQEVKVEQPTTSIDAKEGNVETLQTTRPTRARKNVPPPANLERSKFLTNEVTAYQNKRAEEWTKINEIFKGTNFFVSRTNHPTAYAIWRPRLIALFKGANYADAYHEAWHEFSQMYLTPEQRADLYKQAAKVYGKLSNLELEEHLAEDFRKYMLTGELPEIIKKAKEIRTLFEKIKDFLKNVFTNLKTIDKYFERLEAGRIGVKRNTPEFAELHSSKAIKLRLGEELTELSFEESGRMLDMMDQLFVEQASGRFSPLGESYLRGLYTPKDISDVYDDMYNKLFVDLEESLADDDPRLDTLDILHGENEENWKRLVSYHKQNSPLFTKEMLEEEDQSFFVDKSLDEISQQSTVSQLVLNMVRTLPLYENGEMVFNDLTEVPVFGNFEENWNILQNTLNGLAPEKVRGAIESLVPEYRQFEHLLEYLPKDIKNSSQSQIRNEFLRLTDPRVRSLSIQPKEGGVFVNDTSTLDTKGIMDNWAAQFSATPGEFKIQSNVTHDYYLDGNVFNRWAEAPDASRDPQDTLEFLKAIGFNYSPRAEKAFLARAGEFHSAITQIYEKLKSVATQKGKYQTYVDDPFSAIKSNHRVEGEKKAVLGKYHDLKKLVQLEVDNNPALANDMITSADGTLKWQINQPTYQTIVTLALNDVEKYPYLEYLYTDFPQFNPKFNPYIRRSHYFLDLLFDRNSRFEQDGKIRTPRKKGLDGYNKLDVVALDGATDAELKTIDLPDRKKLLIDIQTLLSKYGKTEENNRIGEKSTTRGLQVIGNLDLFNKEKFYKKEGEVEKFRIPYNIWNIIFDYLADEVDVINQTSVSEDTNKNRIIEGIPQLGLFSDIIVTRNGNQIDVQASNQFKKQVFDFFNNQDYNSKDFLNEIYTHPLAEDIMQAVSYEIYRRANEMEKILKDAYSKEELEFQGITSDEVKRYSAITLIHRTEQFKIFYGHPSYYKNANEVSKRLSAWNASGIFPIEDQANLDYFSSVGYRNQKVFEEYAKQKGIQILEVNKAPDEFTYLVFKDNKVDSQTVHENKNDSWWKKHSKKYINPKNNKTGDIQDAASVLTLDFFKRFYTLSKGLNAKMQAEILRQESIWANYLTTLADPNNQEAKDKLQKDLNTPPHYIFSIKKLQYAGIGMTAEETVPVFHKYSNKVLLPSEVVNNEEAFNILFKLHSSRADYGVFASGTKITETVPAISLYKDGKVNKSPSFPAKAKLKYLKEQQEVEHKEDFYIIFATQFRKLLFKDIEAQEEKDLFDTYKKYIDALVKYDKDKFLEKIENKVLAIEFLIKELQQKNLSAFTLDMIKLTKDEKELKHSIDSLLERTIAESAVVSSARKAIVRQKFYGSQFVQYPVSIVRPDRKLKFYRVENGKIASADCMVSFSKKYHSLALLPYRTIQGEVEAIGQFDSEGNLINPFDTLQRLNEKLESPSFRKKYEKELTLAGVRIPVQGYNSMEHMNIVEFLPEESGQIILVPDELVVKSGGDFDIDKLFMYEPYLVDGQYLTRHRHTVLDNLAKTEIETINSHLDRIKKTFEEVGELKEIIKDSEILLREADSLLEEDKQIIDSQFSALAGLSSKVLSKEDREFNETKRQVNTENLEDAKKSIADEYNRIFPSLDLEVSTNVKENGRRLRAEMIRLQVRKKSLEKNLKRYDKALLQNNLLTIVKERLSQVEIFEDLIEPNNVDDITNEASKVEYPFDKKARTGKLSHWSNLTNPLYQLHVFQLAHAVDMVGIAAKANTFQTVAQDAKLTITDPIFNEGMVLDVNRDYNGNIILYGIYDSLRNRKISNVTSQFISGSVDIIKDDAILKLNLNGETIAVADSLNLMGVPFEQLIKLINTSSIYKLAKGIPFEIQLLGSEFEDYMELGQRGFQEGKTIARFLERITQEKLFENSNLGDMRRLAFFLWVKQSTQPLTDLAINTDFDTSRPQNFESMRRAAAVLKNVVSPEQGKPFFDNKGVLRLIEKSQVSSFNIQQDVLDKFEEMFPISANRKVTDFIIRAHSNRNRSVSRLDFERFSREFKNAVLMSIWQSNLPILENTKILKKGENNIVTLFEELKSELYDKQITIPMMSNIKMVSKLRSEYVVPGLILQDNSLDINIRKEQFLHNLVYQNPTYPELAAKVREFFRIFAYAGIITTGLNKTYYSYLPIIPADFYVNEMTKLLKTQEITPEFLMNVYTRYVHNHPEFVENKDFIPNPSLRFIKEWNLNQDPSLPPYLPATKLDAATEALSQKVYPADDVEDNEVEITSSIPELSKSAKKEKYTIKLSDGTISEREGYKIKTPGFPDTNLRLYKTESGWQVDDLNTGSNIHLLASRTIENALTSLKEILDENINKPEYKNTFKQLGFTQNPMKEIYEAPSKSDIDKANEILPNDSNCK